MISSPYLRTLAGAALGSLAALAARATEPPCSAPAQLWTPSLVAANAANPPNPLQSLGPGAITGDITTQSDQLSTTAAGATQLSGHVDVHLGAREITADQLLYDRTSNSLTVNGTVRYRDPIVLVQGDSGHYGADGAQFSHAQFQFLQQSGYGSAAQITMSPTNVVTLQQVTYTSCPKPRADWQIRARQLVLDTNAGRGIGRGATLAFEDVPILYLPLISFPLSDARQSGFLFPNFSSSTPNGLILTVPWYWNIAPNQDATFTPTVYTKRGVALDTEYRFLGATGEGVLDADYLPHDNATGNERNSVRAVGSAGLGWNTRLDVDAESVSDTQYFEQFAQGYQSTSATFLPRSASATHRDDVWTLRAQALDYQTLIDPEVVVNGIATYPLPADQRPYIQLPRLSATALWAPHPWPQLQLGFDSELVNFTRSCGPQYCLPGTGSVLADFPQGVAVSGWRLDARPQLGLDITGPGYFLRPSFAWDFTRYALRDATSSDTTPQRSLPIIDIDTGLQFERQSGAGGIGNVTLEPRLMYVYIPYRNQDQLPVFDTSVPDPNLIELFRPNRYVGVDRVGDANALTFGVTSQVFASATGTRYLSATIGQSFFLRQPRVILPGQPLDSSTTSSLIGEVILSAYRHWNLQLDVASDPSVARIEQSSVTVQYLASTKQVANLSYRFEQGQIEQLDASGAWPVAKHWDAYARAVYSLRDRSSIEDFVGFQYRGSCWGLRLVAQRSISTRTGQRDTGVSLQVELNGLSGVGTGVSTFLEQSIRGYSASSK